MELDILHINIRSSSEWFGGGKEQLGAVRLETITLEVSDKLVHHQLVPSLLLKQKKLSYYRQLHSSKSQLEGSCIHLTSALGFYLGMWIVFDIQELYRSLYG